MTIYYMTVYFIIIIIIYLFLIIIIKKKKKKSCLKVHVVWMKVFDRLTFEPNFRTGVTN